MTTPQQILEHLGRTTDDILGADDLVTRLRSGRPLRVKFGVDCTAPDLHLGHAVNLWMMRHLQDLGHTVLFHGAQEAARARDAFLAVFSQRGVPDDIPEVRLRPGGMLLDAVLAARPELSRSAARRLISEGAVRIDGIARTDPGGPVEAGEGEVLQAGRRRWFRIGILG